MEDNNRGPVLKEPLDGLDSIWDLFKDRVENNKSAMNGNLRAPQSGQDDEKILRQLERGYIDEIEECRNKYEATLEYCLEGLNQCRTKLEALGLKPKKMTIKLTNQTNICNAESEDV